MKKYKKLLVLCISACMFLLSGCGTELYELTVEEEDLIVHYAAYIVAKHNVQQKDGAINVHIEEDTSSEDTQTTTETETESETDTEGGGGSGEGGEATGAVTLAEAIGHAQDLTITYTGSYVSDNYVEGSVYSIDADEGKTFYIMKFILTNHTAADVAVDNVTLNPSFSIKTETMTKNAEVTFLMTDLSTYVGTIPAGQSVETILLFEVPAEGAEQIANPTLQIIVNKEQKVVKL